ncbi:MAG: hypothetical protein IPL74_04255 [Bacteroidetes bacterium]|nr:hypothetical protein [Bacteroidota bacterium]
MPKPPQQQRCANMPLSGLYLPVVSQTVWQFPAKQHQHIHQFSPECIRYSQLQLMEKEIILMDTYNPVGFASNELINQVSIMPNLPKTASLPLQVNC